MHSARGLFACLTVFAFLLASPSSAYPGMTPIANAGGHHDIIAAGHHRYADDFDDDDFDDAPFAPSRRADPYPPPPDATPFLEFLPPPRPANCGEFRYWNGTYCADAREQPPYVGPRW